MEQSLPVQLSAEEKDEGPCGDGEEEGEEELANAARG